MTEIAAGAGAALAWIGVTLVTVADGRLGYALGLVLVSGGLGLAGAAAGQAPVGTAALIAGGVVAAALRLRDGPAGWSILPSGSTPRLTAAIVALIGAGVAAGSILGTPLGAARVAALVVALLAGGHVLTVGDRWAALGAAAALALGLGALGGTTALAAGAAVAACLGAIDGAEPAGRARAEVER